MTDSKIKDGVLVNTRPRLKFIDMARSLAILLMLEGHFTGATLSDDYRKSEYWLYNFWHNLHGVTSPLFFTVTGVVFIYLLSKSVDERFQKNDRVKKGFKRVRMLLFWGYFIQLDLLTLLRDLYYGFKGLLEGKGWRFVFHFEWLQAFHVLQSIGIGIFLLLITFGIYKFINKGALFLYYFATAIVVFIFYAYMKQHINIDDELIKYGQLGAGSKHYLPEGYPKFIQNMFYGQFSDFSFLRYSGYVLMGGMIGAIIRKYEAHVRKWWFSFSFMAVGLLLAMFVQLLFVQIDSFTDFIHLTADGVFVNNSTSFVRLGQVILLLGFLMLLDSNFNIKAQLFLKLGQNTFPIYIVHVIVLYGGILGFGLSSIPSFDRQLTPWMSVSISAFFISSFILMVKYIEPITAIYNKVLGFFKPKRRKINS